VSLSSVPPKLYKTPEKGGEDKGKIIPVSECMKSLHWNDYRKFLECCKYINSGY